MPHLLLLPTIARELLCRRRLRRTPEPLAVMDRAQAEQYAEAGRADGVLAGMYLFHTARAAQVIQGCRRVLDLGCGPARQLHQIAELHPEVEFLGIDLSVEVLATAKAHAGACGARNLEFREADITDLGFLGDGSCDGVISTVALHHLSTVDHLEACLREVRRVLAPAGAVFLSDFGRLRSRRSVDGFVRLNRRHAPDLISRDYEDSLRAAFSPDELRAALSRALPSSVRTYTPFGVPFLILAKSLDRPLPAVLAARLRTLRKRLPPFARRDLDSLRLFFSWGGLPTDPFR